LAQHFPGGFADEEVDMFQLPCDFDTLIEEMPGTGERPTPARRDDFAHMLPIHARARDHIYFKRPDLSRKRDSDAGHSAALQDGRGSG
jgi:hypothetical protein